MPSSPEVLPTRLRVTDPYDLPGDPSLPFATGALDPTTAEERLREGITLGGNAPRELRLRSIRAIRHKPGRRCLVEYGLELVGPDGSGEDLLLLGKARARGLDTAAHQLQRALWSGGFGAGSPSGVSVPEPLGTIPAFNMWLQRRVPGVDATSLLLGPCGATLAARVAEALHQVHRLGPPARRRHAIADELRILHERIPRVAQENPRWAGRLERLLTRCDSVGARLPAANPCGIHRDFYPDQVIVGEDRLHLLDFDLYCCGDPALDVGNFLGHLVELALRTCGDAFALQDRELAFEQRYLELAGGARRSAIRGYTTLTLVRHIHLSTLFPDRRPYTERLLELCEERLSP